jgi:hypothetical protein
MTIVGVKFNKISWRSTDSSGGSCTLRHYEEIRSIMLKNDHNHGTIWITGFRSAER